MGHFGGVDASLGSSKLSVMPAWRELLPAGLEGWTVTFYDGYGDINPDLTEIRVGAA